MARNPQTNEQRLIRNERARKKYALNKVGGISITLTPAQKIARSQSTYRLKIKNMTPKEIEDYHNRREKYKKKKPVIERDTSFINMIILNKW